MELDVAAFETALHALMRAALARFAEDHRGERFYAVALYGVERELDGRMSLPLLAASCEEHGPAAEAPSTFWGARFSPADWPYQEIELEAEIALQLERALEAEATRSTPGHWRATERWYARALIEVARALHDDAVTLLTTSDELVCFWHDEEGGDGLARETIAPALWERLFAREAAQLRERTRVDALPPAERAALLVSRFGARDGVDGEAAQAALLAMGADAVDALVTRLGDKQYGSVAAKLLGKIGIAAPAMLATLRAQASQPWYAMALGMLGDHAWLAAQGPAIAVDGLCARLKSITQGGPARPLDYAPLEAYLDAMPSERTRVEQTLRPGTSYVEIQPGDVGEAVRGLASRHDVVRWHAAAVLGDRELGDAAGVTVLPALADALRDPNPLVRRLAVLSLSYWKAAAAPYHGAIRAMHDDPDPVVRSVAAQVG